MIKKLRFRFIFITIISLLIVLSSIMTVVNIVNYSKVRDYADDILAFLSTNGGRFDMPEKPSPDFPSMNKPSPEHRPEPMPEDATVETPYETRYFTVTYGGSISADISHIAKFSEGEAIAMGNKVIASGESNGYEGNYRFLVNENKTRVIFVDCTRQLKTAKNFLIVSILSSIGGTLCVFILLFIFSKRAVAPIVESYEKQKRFITDAGHELKTPLTIISANNELSEITSGKNEYSDAIAKQVSRMNLMVKNLSLLATIDEKSNESKKTTFPISSLCEEICDLFVPVFSSEGKRLEVEIKSSEDYFGNRSLINQLLLIILENASKYSLSYAKLTLAKIGKRISIALSNDCSNLKNGSLNRVFERFYRSDDARASSIEGSGIGLCIAREIVDLHCGEISALGQDNIFTLKIIL